MDLICFDLSSQLDFFQWKNIFGFCCSSFSHLTSGTDFLQEHIGPLAPSSGHLGDCTLVNLCDISTCHHKWSVI